MLVNKKYDIFYKNEVVQKIFGLEEESNESGKVIVQDNTNIKQLLCEQIRIYKKPDIYEE